MGKPNWRNASDAELMTVIKDDPTSRLSDIVEARDEYERRNRKAPSARTNWQEKKVYPR